MPSFCWWQSTNGWHPMTASNNLCWPLLTPFWLFQTFYWSDWPINTWTTMYGRAENLQIWETLRGRNVPTGVVCRHFLTARQIQCVNRGAASLQVWETLKKRKMPTDRYQQQVIWRLSSAFMIILSLVVGLCFRNTPTHVQQKKRSIRYTLSPARDYGAVILPVVSLTNCSKFLSVPSWKTFDWMMIPLMRKTITVSATTPATEPLPQA